MGNGEKVLVIGRHAFMMEQAIKLLTQNNYRAVGVQKNQEAVDLFKSENPDAVVIGGGVDEESRMFFHQEFSKQNSPIKIIDAHPVSILKDLQNAFNKNNSN